MKLRLVLYAGVALIGVGFVTLFDGGAEGYGWGFVLITAGLLVLWPAGLATMMLNAKGSSEEE